VEEELIEVNIINTGRRLGTETTDVTVTLKTTDAAKAKKVSRWNDFWNK